MKTDNSKRFQKRGTVVVLVAVSSVMILGFGALSLDLGQLYVARCELQAAADSAVLAGASAYFTDAGLAQDASLLGDIAYARCSGVGGMNTCRDAAPILERYDMVLGTHYVENAWASLDASGVDRFNAVEVTLRYAPGSANGGIPFLFAPIWGLDEGGVTVRARAAALDRLAQIRMRDSERPFPALMPFTMMAGLYEQQTRGGSDNWTYDSGVISGSDGIDEARLFPWREKDTPVEQGEGNFGSVSIGAFSTSELEVQIANGITPAELQGVFGSSEISFATEYGEAVSYDVPGSPGLAAALESALQARVGEVVSFFLHDRVSGSGSNAVYGIVGIRVGRIMDVDLSGSFLDKRLVIQPLAYTGGQVIVNEWASPTDGQVGRVVLVR